MGTVNLIDTGTSYTPQGEAVIDDVIDQSTLRATLLAAMTGNLRQFDESRLRVNQLKSISALTEKLRDPSWDLKGYFIQPTGAGKTVNFGVISKLLDQSTIIFVPKAHLLNQTKRELIDVCGFTEEEIGIVGDGQRELGKKVTICTYQSHLALQKDRAYKNFFKSIKVAICDEAHKSLGEATKESLAFEDTDLEMEAGEVDVEDLNEDESDAEDQALENLNKTLSHNVLKLGFTATPQLSKKHIADAFGNCEIARIKYIDLVRAGILAKYKVYHTEGTLVASEDLTNYKVTQANEKKILDQEHTYEKLLNLYLEKTREVGKLLGLAFCANTDECDDFIKKANELGLKCIRVTSKDDKEALKRAEEGLLDGTYDLAVTVDKLTEGWDFPPLNAVINARVTESAARLLQGAGRASRRIKGKDYAYIFETDWRIRGRRKGDGTGGSTPSSTLFTGEGSEENCTIRRFNLFEALLLNGEDPNDIREICSLNDQQNDFYEFTEKPEPMNGEYFSQIDKISKDLIAYAEASNLAPSQLYPNVMYKRRIACANNELVSGNAYLKRAGIAFGMGTQHTDIWGKEGEVLRRLKSFVGIPIPTIQPLDAIYFGNIEFLRSDLEAYGRACTPSRTVEELQAKNFETLKVLCNNGEEVLGVTYLNRFAIAHGLKVDGRYRKNWLKEAKNKLGIKSIEEMDKVYLENLENIRADFEGFAAACKPPTSVKDLNTRDTLVRHTCLNGETISFGTYLNRIASLLGFGSPHAAGFSRVVLLETLKTRLGIEGVKSMKMDKAYFENVEILRADLSAFAQAISPTANLESVNAGNAADTTATCRNGETISARLYASRAAVALGLVKNSQEASLQLAFILEYLRSLLGIEVLTYRAMDKDYFNDKESIQKDLETFALALSVHRGGVETTINDLNSKSLTKVDAVCSNKELVKGQAYLNRAKKALGIDKRSEVIEFLKKLIGIEIVDYLEMDQAYFTPATILKDLRALAESLGNGMTVERLSTENLKKASAKCASGETLNGATYLRRAAVGLGLATTAREGQLIPGPTMRRLQELIKPKE